MNQITYMRSQENLSYKFIKDVNKQTKWFKIIQPTAEYSSHDFECIDKKGRLVFIESKIRNIKHNQYPTVFIELKKFRYMKELSKEGISLYINFFNDGTALLWNLDKIEESDLELSVLDVTMSNINKTIQNAERLNLPINKAIKINYDIN